MFKSRLSPCKVFTFMSLDDKILCRVLAYKMQMGRDYIAVERRARKIEIDRVSETSISDVAPTALHSPLAVANASL